MEVDPSEFVKYMNKRGCVSKIHDVLMVGQPQWLLMGDAPSEVGFPDDRDPHQLSPEIGPLESPHGQIMSCDRRFRGAIICP